MGRRKFEVGDYCKGYWSGKIGTVISIHKEKYDPFDTKESVVYYVRMYVRVFRGWTVEDTYQWQCERFLARDLVKKTLTDVQLEAVQEELNERRDV